MEFNTWIRAIRPGLSAHLLPPLLLGQGIAFYLQQTFALAISLQVLILGFALHAAIGLGRAYADAPAPQLRTMVFAASLVLAQTLLLATRYNRPYMPLFAALALLLFWAHSFPPLALRVARRWRSVIQALGFGLLLPLIGYYAQTGTWHPLPRTLFLPYILLQLAAAIALAFPHRDAVSKIGTAHGDAAPLATGKKTLPALLGYRKAAALAVALCLGAQYQLVWNWGLPTLVLGIMLIPIATLLATAPLRSKLDDSPDHRRTFKRLVLSPGYIYALGFCLAQLWP